MKLELQSRREQQQQQQEEEEEEEAGAAPGPAQAPPETQDFQEYLAENERAVLHLHRAQELERLKEEEDSGPGGDGGGLCVLGEHLDGTTWQVKTPPCPGLSPPGLIPSRFPPGSPVLGFPVEPPAQVSPQVGPQMGPQVSSHVSSQVGSQPYLAEAPGLYCASGEGGNGQGEPLVPACPGKDLGVPPVSAAASDGGTPPDPLAYLGQPHLHV
ncbi:CSRN2 protein, partial [Formicarius rufipectus]|nr:CSRN2 protein [Formicarius rufipectus]